MNDLLQHAKYVGPNYTDKTAALALVDHLQEDCGLTKLEALKQVALHRREGRNAHELKEAVAALARDARWAAVVRMFIQRAARYQSGPEATINLVPGSRPPRSSASVPYMADGEPLWRHLIVGVRWVIKCRAEVLRQAREEPDPTPAFYCLG